MTRRFAFEPEARETYLALRKDADSSLCITVQAVLAELLENPGARRLRQLRYRPDAWAVPLRCGDLRWLVVWRPSDADTELIQVHYIGPAPGEQ